MIEVANNGTSISIRLSAEWKGPFFDLYLLKKALKTSLGWTIGVGFTISCFIHAWFSWKS